MTTPTWFHSPFRPYAATVTTHVTAACIHECAATCSSDVGVQLKTLACGVRCHHYLPSVKGKQRVVGLVIIVAGPLAEMGPGTPRTNHAASPSTTAIFPVLARRLATDGFAVLHMMGRGERRPPVDPAVRRSPKQLEACLQDVEAAARFLRVVHEHESAAGAGGSLSLTLLSHGDGGPAAMAAAAASLRMSPPAPRGLAPLAGVIAVSSSVRANDASHSFGESDTVAATRALAARSVPLLLMHGLDDATIDPHSTSLIFESAGAPKAAVYVRGADHLMRARFKDVLQTLLAWTRSLQRRFCVSGDAEGQMSPPQEVEDEGSIAFGRAVCI